MKVAIEGCAWVLRCAACLRPFQVTDGHSSCPDCGGLLDVERSSAWDDPAELRARFASRSFIDGSARDRSGVWRYRDLLFDVPEKCVVTLPEGNTPLVRHERVTSYAGVAELAMKHEGMNPTASFKDRGMTLLSALRRVSARQSPWLRRRGRAIRASFCSAWRLRRPSRRRRGSPARGS